jgi:Cu/Ag efflux protein CusF
MRKFVLIAQLVLGLTLMAFASAPLTSAIAHEGEEHETINGVVQRVDETAGKITLKHGPIKSLGMDQGMTPTLLKGIKVGDKVMFQPERVNGQLTVTKIEKAK